MTVRSERSARRAERFGDRTAEKGAAASASVPAAVAMPATASQSATRRDEREVLGQERVDCVGVVLLRRAQIAAARVPVRDQPGVEIGRTTGDVLDARTDPLRDGG